jgi:adenylate kinase
VGKEGIVRELALAAAKARGLRQDLNDRYTRQFVQVLSVEEEIKSTLGDLRPFLNQILPHERNRRWREAMETIFARVSDSEHTLLCLHNVFYRRSNFFTCTDWELLRRYRPTVMVTLINDLYDVWETINDRERKLATNSYFHLPEILAWRSAEISATESLAENLYVRPHVYGLGPDRFSSVRKDYPALSTAFGHAVPHFLFAAKHPLETLYQLLFRRDFLLVYASFPITKTRNDSQGRTEIDGYRQRLFESGFLTVLDPLTIDELRFIDSWQPGKPALRPRWPLTLGPPMLEEIPLTTDPFTGYNELQFNSLKSSVERHVEVRDYKMVSQTMCLAAYRPFYGGVLGSNVPPSDKPSGGVDKELMYAVAESKLIYAFHPPQDRRDEAQVFSSVSFAVSPTRLEDLLGELHKVQQQRTSRSGQDQNYTWE